MRPIIPLAVTSLLVAVSLGLAGCAGGTLARLPDGGYERESRSTMEQRAADALRRAGASTEAREAQKRADAALDAERKSPGFSFFADLLYAVFGEVLEQRTGGGNKP
jgi:hypothetical protein